MGGNGKKKKTVKSKRELKKIQKRKVRANRRRKKIERKESKKAIKKNNKQHIHNNHRSQEAALKSVKEPQNKKRMYSPRKKRKIKITPAQRKVMKIVLSIFIILIISVSAAFVFGKIFFKAENIIVYGQSQYTEDEIKNATGLSISDNLLFCRTDKIRANIENTLPCADVVSVKKELPSTLILEIKQTKAKFNIKTSDGYIYMSDDYRIFEKGSDIRDNGTIVKGINYTFDELKSSFEDSSDGVVMIFRSIIECCDKLSLEGITEINLTDPMNPSLIYDSRITINLGTPEELEYKIQMVNNTLTSGSISSQIKGTLDVSLAGDKNRTYFKPDYS